MLFVKVSKEDKTCYETQRLILYDKKLGKPAKGNCRTNTFSDHTMLLINFQIRHLASAKKEFELDTTLRNVILVGLTMGVMPRDRARNETVRTMPGQKYG